MCLCFEATAAHLGPMLRLPGLCDVQLHVLADEAAPHSHAQKLSHTSLLLCIDWACARARQVDGDLDADGDEEPLDDDWGLDEEHA